MKHIDVPIEYGYWNDIIELEIHCIPAGIVNILYKGKVPTLDVVEIIKENYAKIVDKVIEEQTRILWETREKYDQEQDNYYWEDSIELSDQMQSVI
ncbi:MAG: hypothetical protein Q7I98_07375 [Erysipelotrichaceae bacterium]|nr:hypothetical protein [Erysipelotrichaceae bacterium]